VAVAAPIFSPSLPCTTEDLSTEDASACTTSSSQGDRVLQCTTSQGSSQGHELNILLSKARYQPVTCFETVAAVQKPYS
jgi:hypothetical protein